MLGSKNMVESTSKEKETKEKKEEATLKKEEIEELSSIKLDEKEKQKEVLPQEHKKEEKDIEKEAGAIKEKKASILFKKKPLRILLLLLQNKSWYPSLLARESEQSYVHTTKILHSLEGAGIITAEFNGKKKTVKLTEKGEKIANTLEDLTKNI